LSSRECIHGSWGPSRCSGARHNPPVPSRPSLFSAEPTTAVDLDSVLREIYILYTDCALKDPFYELEMPIRCELFSVCVDNLIQRMEKVALRGGR
jgi:hypothetical protein